jgi:glycosyltransferase involved in cell wall biosynthesis
MKAILVNNYDLLGILNLLQEEHGNAPSQHLWGYDSLTHHDIRVDILPFQGSAFLKKISGKLKIFGDLDQQLRLLSNCRRYDVIYSAHYLTTTLLSFLSILGFLKKPIVAIGYQAPRTKAFHWKLFVKTFIEGNNKILCLSESLLRDLEDFGVPRQKLDLIEWGADLRFYQPDNLSESAAERAGRERFILSPGKSYRDYPTLVKAFENLDCGLTICGAGQIDLKHLKQRAVGSAEAHLPSNVSILRDMIDWRDFIRLYEQAYAVAIPVVEEKARFKNAIGLTVLTEAMAMGKAIAMTRSDYVGVDLEREGIGLWVEEGDVDGWQRAIAYLLDNPKETREMGRRARLLAEQRFNLEQFSKKLADSLWQAYNAQQPARPTTPVRQRALLR